MAPSNFSTFSQFNLQPIQLRLPSSFRKLIQTNSLLVRLFHFAPYCILRPSDTVPNTTRLSALLWNETRHDAAALLDCRFEDEYSKVLPLEMEVKDLESGGRLT